MSPPRCRVSGCRRKAHARGLCQKHYDEQRKSKSPRRSAKTSRGRGRPSKEDVSPERAPAAEEILPGKVCCVPGCANPHHAKGYCKSHYGQLRRHGHIEDLPPEAARAGAGLSREQRLIEIKKRHELLKREIASIHKALESESDEDS